MADAYSDGNFVGMRLTANVVSYPFAWPNNSNVKAFELEYVQAAANYTDVALGSTDANATSAFLVEKGPVLKIAPGFVRFRRMFVQQPVDWVEKQQVSYTFPGLSGPISPNAQTFNPYYFRAPASLYATATVYHNYSQGATAPDPDPAFQVTDGGNVVDYIGPQNPNIGAGLTSPNVEPATYNVSSTVSQIRALIWETTTLVVPKPV